MQGLMVPTDADSLEVYDIEDMLTLEEWCSTERLLTKTEQQYITETTTVFQRVSAMQNKNLIFYIGAFVQFCLYMEALLISPHLTDIARSFGMSDQERDLKLGGMLQLCLFCTGLPVSLLSGNLGDRWDSTKVIVVFGALGAAGNLATFFVQNFAQFLLSRAFSSISCATSNVFMSVISQLYSHGERPIAIGQYNAVMGLGVGAGVLVSVTLGQILGWRFAFLLVGIVQGGSILLFWLRVPARRHLQQVYPVEKACVAPTKVESAQLVDSVLFNGLNVAIFAQAVFAGVPSSCVGVWLLDYLSVDAHAPSKFQALMVVMSYGIGLILGQVNLARCLSLFSISVLADQGASHLCIVVFYLVPVIPLVLVWSSQFSLWMVGAMAFAGFFAGLNVVAVRTLLMNCNQISVHSSLFCLLSVFESIGKGPGIMLISWLIAETSRRDVLSQNPVVWAIPAGCFSILYCLGKSRHRCPCKSSTSSAS